MATQTPPAPRHDDDHGFSLLEVLVVITVLGILATIVVFAVRNSTDDAEAAAYAADARTIETAQEAYAATTGSYGDEDELVAAGHLRRPSDLHDIEMDDGGFRIVRADGSGESAGGTDDTGESVGGVGEAGTTTTAPTTTTVPATTTTVPATTTTVPATTTTAPATTTTAPAAPAGKVACALTVTEAWSSGANAELTITNATDRALSSWTVRIDGRGNRISFWEAKTDDDRGTVNASNRKYNGKVPAGTTTNVSGAGVRGGGLAVGDTFPCDVITPKPDLDDLDCELDVTQTWYGGGSVRLSIENDGKVDVSSWTVKLEAEDVRLSGWSGADVATTDGDTFTLTSQDWTAFIDAGETQRSVTAQASGKLGKKTDFDCKVVAAD